MKTRALIQSLLLFTVILGLLVAPGCGGSNRSSSASQDEPIKIAYVAWEDAVATTNVVEQVLEQKMGKDVELELVNPNVMWQGVAIGDYDAFVAGWLPTTHKKYWDKYKDRVEDLGPNLKGAKIGMVVPDYVQINSIPELKGKAGMFDGKITGIDPGAGIMDKTSKAIDAYGLDSYTLESSSDAVMTAQLADAINRHKPIVVTGWTPHWMFARWNLKYLDDPKGVYGNTEQIHTIVRPGLKEDRPDVYAFLKNFHWTTDDVQQVMQWNQEDHAKPSETAKRWIDQNPEKVNAWLSETDETSETSDAGATTAPASNKP